MKRLKLNPDYLVGQILRAPAMKVDGTYEPTTVDVVLHSYLPASERETIKGPNGTVTLDCLIMTGPGEVVKATSALLTP